MNWLKNIGQNIGNRVLHGLVPAAGAALPFILTAVAGGPVAWAAMGKVAAGAFAAYVLKPTRTDTPATPAS